MLSSDERRRKRQKPLDGPGDADSYTLDSAVEMLLKRFDETNQKIDSSRDELNSKLDSIKKDLQKQIMLVEQDLSTLRTTCDAEHKSLHSRVDHAAETVQRLENRTELIVAGIPYLANENLRSYLLSISNAIGFDNDKVSHIYCKRLRSVNLSDGNECFILLQFSVAGIRDEFYSMYLAKRDLILKHIGMSSDRRIYINENLTVNARTIKRAALKLRRENKLVAVSTRYGVVQVKKTTNGKYFPISSIDQLKQI